MQMLRLLGLLLTADGRRYLRALWWTIRHNHANLHGGRVTLLSPTATITVIKPDNRLYRVHGVPARHVEDYIEFFCRKGERVLIGEEGE